MIIFKILAQHLSGSSSASSSPNFLEMDEIDEQSSQKDANTTGNSSRFGASLSPKSPLDASDYAYATLVVLVMPIAVALQLAHHFQARIQF